MRSGTEDPHDQQLIDLVQPPTWKNPTRRDRYNLVAIGGGSGGIISALATAGLGGTSALIERHRLGGDCLNYGCVPSKALLSAAKVAHTVRTSEAYGVQLAQPPEIDFPAIMRRMRAVRAGIATHDSAARFAELGTDVFLGEARFTGPDTLDVAGQRIRFARCVIATGSRANVPPIAGLAEAGYLTNETLFSLTELPRRLAVLGMGPIGSEMAQAFRRFGSEVHAIEQASHPLSREDAEVGEVLTRRFKAEGIHVHLHSVVTGVESTETGKRVHYTTGGKEHSLEVDQILVALGRRPNIENLNLPAAGVETTRRGIFVNDRLQSTNPKIFAAGDVAGEYQFTHAADAMARLCVQNALFYGRGKLSDLVMPWCTYTDPEVAHVGLSAKGAQQHGIAIDTYREDFSHVDRALVESPTADQGPTGFALIHTTKGSGKVLGGTIVGPHAGELIAELTLLMTTGKSLSHLAGTIHCYPTRAEVLKRIADKYQKTRLRPWIKNLFTRWLEWQRT